MITRAVPLLVTVFVTPCFAAEPAFYSATTDRLERYFDDERYVVETLGEWRSDEHAVIVRIDGSKPDAHDFDGELQFLYARPLSSYFDWQVGIESEFHDGDTALGVVLGLEGEAPYRIESELRVSLNEHGDVILHAEFEHDFLLTQRLAMQPRLEIRTGAHDEKLATELRLKYEVTRKFAPYVGVSWERQFGSSSGIETAALAGVSFWF